MTTLVWNMFLAILWAVLNGEITLANLVIGFLLGAVVLSLVQRGGDSPRYLWKLRKTVELALFFLWVLLLSNLRVAYDVVTRRHHMRPGIVAVPLEAKTSAEITLLANLVTLTPGTISLDLSADHQTLYVHSMYIRTPEATRREIKVGFERRVLEVLR